MNAENARAVRTQHLARPGGRAIVATDLALLRGPKHGVVELPLRLYWSSKDRTFDLDEPFMARWLYQIVLREASTPEDLTEIPNRDLLISFWPDLHLPKGVRQAWEERYLALRVAMPVPHLMTEGDSQHTVARVAGPLLLGTEWPCRSVSGKPVPWLAVARRCSAGRELDNCCQRRLNNDPVSAREC